MMTKLSHLAELFLQDSLYPLLMRRKCGNVSCMCKKLHSWTAWGPRVLWGLAEGLTQRVVDWRGRFSFMFLLIHWLINFCCLFIFHYLGWISYQFASDGMAMDHPKPLAKNVKFWAGRNDRMVSVWLDGLHNFGEQGHAGLFLMPTWTGNLQQ